MKLVSIDSVLFDLSTLIDEQYFDKTTFKEWALKAYRMLNAKATLTANQHVVNVSNHRGQLPDYKYVIQCLAFNIAGTNIQLGRLPYNDTLSLNNDLYLHAIKQYDKKTFAPMYKSTSSFGAHLDLCIDQVCVDCKLSYTIKNDIIETSFKEGKILVSTLDYSGDMIIDDEELKEALTEYVLFRYYGKKKLIKEEGAERERDWHGQRWAVLKAKVQGKLNMPTLDELENLKNQLLNLLPNNSQWESGFGNLNSKTNIITS